MKRPWNYVEQHCNTWYVCQLTKKQRKKNGLLPPKEAKTIPWKQVNINVIDPYIVQRPTKTHQLTAATMIDPVTSWFKVAPLSEPSSFETMRY